MKKVELQVVFLNYVFITTLSCKLLYCGATQKRLCSCGGFQWTTKGWNIVNRYVKNPNFTLKHQIFAYFKTYLIKK